MCQKSQIGQGKSTLNQAFVARIIKLTPSWAKVAIGQQTKQKHCLSGHTKGESLYLGVYVNRSDLIPVVTTKTTKVSDGTEVTLWPGLPLTEQSKATEPRGTYEILVLIFLFPVYVKTQLVYLEGMS